MYILKFHSIDFWNRPIFKCVDKVLYFCSVDKLFDYGATPEEVEKEITKDDIVYHGTSIDCDPDGRSLKHSKFELIY